MTRERWDAQNEWDGHDLGAGVDKSFDFSGRKNNDGDDNDEVSGLI